MRKFALAAATAATAGALGLAGVSATAAQAASLASHAKATTRTVAAGLVTSADITLSASCASGNTVSVSSTPALPTSVQSDNVGTPSVTKVRFEGVYPATPTSYAVTIKCGTVSTTTGTIKVEASPAVADVVGVGSDTIQNVLDQFSGDYNNTKTGAKLWSWDALNPLTGAQSDPIVTKTGCSSIPRPDGSSAGITALTTENAMTSGHPCMDFARSSRARSSTDPTSISFVDLAGDAETYATQPTTNAPANLSTAQLISIYSCTVSNWDQVGGKNAPIHAFIPQPGSGTRSFWLAALGLSAPGSCVSDDGGTLQENEGVNPVLNDPNAIVDYSIGKYIAERYHSAKCLNTACTANSNGITCTPKGTQNLFGCDTHGTMALHMIDGTNPTVPFPLTNTTKNAIINSGFSPTFQRLLYDVVVSPESGGVGTIPSYLQPTFGPTGWICTNSTAKKDLANYGFLVLPNGTSPGDCGSAQ